MLIKEEGEREFRVKKKEKEKNATEGVKKWEEGIKTECKGKRK